LEKAELIPADVQIKAQDDFSREMKSLFAQRNFRKLIM
jgi:hypothetical protein